MVVIWKSDSDAKGTKHDVAVLKAVNGKITAEENIVIRIIADKAYLSEARNFQFSENFRAMAVQAERWMHNVLKPITARKVGDTFG